jgi:serine protease Do
VGNCHNLLTARHVVEHKRKVEIRGINGEPIRLHSLRVPSFGDLDVALMVVEQNAMDGLPYLRFESPRILEEVLCMGYPPIPGFEAVQISDIASINSRVRVSRGRIVAQAESYLETQEYLLIKAKVKGGNSGGPLINKRGYTVGILVVAPLNAEDTTSIDELGYGIAVPEEAFRSLLNQPSLLTDLPFTNFSGGGFSTLPS